MGTDSHALHAAERFFRIRPEPRRAAHTRGHMVLSQPAHRIYRTLLIAAIMGFLFAFIDFYAQRCFLFGTGEFAPFYHSLSVFFYCIVTALVVNAMSPKIVRSKKRKEFLRFLFSHPDLRRKAREQYGSEFRIPDSDSTDNDDSDEQPDEERSADNGQAEGKDGTQSVYVGNIPFRTDRQEIEDLFRTVGEVYSVKCFQKHSRKESYSYAFVEMNAAEAQKAIEQLDGTELDGRKLVVRASNSGQDGSSDRGNPRSRKTRKRGGARTATRSARAALSVTDSNQKASEEEQSTN